MLTNRADRTATVQNHERHFYATKHAFGRFGMRIFQPQKMQHPHWHGHIEANFAIGVDMTYDMDGEVLVVPRNRLVLFWAGIPHCLTDVGSTDPATQRLCNIYLPLDAFLMMHHITALQVNLLGGGMIVLPESLCSEAQVQRWYADYRTGDFERAEVIKMELNALFRRSVLEPPEYLRAPYQSAVVGRELSSAHIRHVIAMVRHVLENLAEPMTNARITAVTGLHENYALTLFTRVMRLPLKQFVIRMRLVRARALLVESAMAIADVVEASGFTSVTQFYAHFRAAYGTSPAALRHQYIQMALAGYGDSVV